MAGLGSVSLNMFWSPSISGSNFLQASMGKINTYATKLNKVNILGATKFPLLNRNIKQLQGHLGHIRTQTAKISATPIRLDIKTSRTSLKEARKDMTAIEHDAKQVAFWTKKSSENLQKGARVSKVNTPKPSQVGSGAMVGAIATATVMTLPFKASIEFESSMADVKALTKNITAEDFILLTAKAKELGSTTEWSASQSAIGMTYLAKAGFDTKQQLSAMNGVLGLATAGSVDLATSSNIASNILSGFGIKAENMGNVSDVLAKTFTTSNTDLQMLGETMKYTAPIASGLGIGLSEVSALAGKLGDVGIQGSMAGTSIRTMYTRLSAPPTEARKAMDALGLSVFDAKGKFRGMPNIIGQLNKSMVGMSDGDKTAKLKALFGMEALSSGIALMKVGKSGLLDYQSTLENSAGTTKKIQDIKLATTSGQFKLLSSAMEGLSISATTGLLPAINYVSNILTSTATKLDAFTNKFPTASKWIFGLGTAFVVGAVALAGFGFIASGVGAGLALLASPVTAIVLGVMAIGASAVFLYKKFEIVRSSVDGFFSGLMSGINPVLTGFTTIFSDIGSSISGIFSSTVPIFSAIGTVLNAVGINFKNVGSIIGTVFSIALFPIRMVFKAIGWVLSAVNGLFSGFISGITPVVTQIGGLFGMVKTSFMGLYSSVSPIISAVGSVLSFVGGIVAGAFSLMLTPFKMIFSAVGWVLSSIGVSFESVGSVFNSVGSAVAGVFSVVLFPIKMVLAVISSVLDMGKMVIDGWMLIGKTAGAIFGGIVNIIKSPFVSFFSWIESKFKAILGLVDKVRNIASSVKNVGSTVVNGVKDKASSVWSGTKNFFGFNESKKPQPAINNVAFTKVSKHTPLESTKTVENVVATQEIFSLKEIPLQTLPIESVSDVTANQISETKTLMQNNSNSNKVVTQTITNQITIHSPDGSVDEDELYEKMVRINRRIADDENDMQMQDVS